MDRPLRRKDIPAQRREQILEAAAELFSRGGYQGVTVDAIAERAGVSKGNVYWYFNSKREILKSLVDDFYRRLGAPLEEILQSDAPPREKLRSLTTTFLGAAEANKEAMMLMLQIAAQPELLETVLAEASGWLRDYVDTLSQLFAEMGEERPREVASAYVAIMDGLMGHVATASDVYDTAGIMAVLEERFIDYRRPHDA